MTLFTKTFDAKCLDLADHFLADTPETWRGMHRQELAFAIQERIEDYLRIAEDYGYDQPTSDEGE